MPQPCDGDARKERSQRVYCQCKWNPLWLIFLSVCVCGNVEEAAPTKPCWEPSKALKSLRPLKLALRKRIPLESLQAWSLLQNWWNSWALSDSGRNVGWREGMEVLPLKMLRCCCGPVAQLVGASFGTPKGCGFDSRSGHIPRLWVQFLVGACTRGNWPMCQCFSLMSMFLSLSLSNL